MKTIFVDVETYYSNDYSLRKMTPVEYILDPRFECIGWAVAEGNNPATWMSPQEFQAYLKSFTDDVALVSHNALFDMPVVAWRMGFVPKLMIDTLGMARAWLGHELKSLSLANVATHLGLGVKGDTVHKVIGMSARDIQASGLWDSYTDYALNDVELCRSIYLKLMKDGFPKQELIVMDTVLRCAVQPKFNLDLNVLAEHLHLTQQGKQNLLDRCGLATRDDLMSNDKFAAALQRLGVEPPLKTSLVTGKSTYAFAKTDPAFIELEEHPDPDVQALVSARLGLKSTLEETRTQRLTNIAHAYIGRQSEPKMPIPLRYSGAHTHRLSGDWKLNMQNLPRGGKLRSALVSPSGYTVLAADASQIEARLVAWFCGETDLVQQFANGEDIYSSFASKVFGYPVNKKDHPAERFIGKTAILGLGYGLGWEKFMKTVKLQSKAQTGQVIDMGPEEAQRVVGLYRETYSNIASMWRRLNAIIPEMTNQHCRITLGPVVFEHERVHLPSGLRLHYANLENTTDGWQFKYAGKSKRLYGGKMLENIIQALARICVMDAAVRVRKRFSVLGDGLDLAMQVHDELVYVVPNDLAGPCKQILLEEMGRRPLWAEDLPLAAEADMGANYGEAK